MRPKRRGAFCVVLVVAVSVIMPTAMAWGPNASRGICLCALQVIRRDVEGVFQGRENDLIAGASISDQEMSPFVVLGGEIDPSELIVSQIALLRRANEAGMTDYLAFRFGVLAKMTANAIQPFGIPENEDEMKIKLKLDADVEKHVGDLNYRLVKREFIYYPASYFKERRRFLNDAKYFIRQEYSEKDEYGEYSRRAAAKYFEDAINAVADVWYTVFTPREHFAETPPSPRDVAEYYAGQVDYFLKKSLPDKAEESYAIFSSVNPGLAALYEKVADAYYRAGNRERAMDEYRRGLSMKGSWREVEQKIVKYYTEAGGKLLTEKSGDALQKALQSYEKALEVSPGDPEAISGRENARSEIEALQARLDRDKELIAGGERLIQEAGQAESARDLAKAIDLYEKAAAVYSLVSSEFKEEQSAARDASEDAANRIGTILTTALAEGQNLMNEASQRELEGQYEIAMKTYDRVPGAVSIVTKKYSDRYEEAQKLIQSATQKKAAAQASLERQKTESAQRPVPPPVAPTTPPGGGVLPTPPTGGMPQFPMPPGRMPGPGGGFPPMPRGGSR